MAIYVALGKATAEGVKRMSDLSGRHKAAVQRAEAAGGKVLASYALGGPYDYVVVLDCPDHVTALKILTQEAARGNVRYETYAAVPTADFAKAVAG
jgi:uncharacterized protein with GYD domain